MAVDAIDGSIVGGEYSMGVGSCMVPAVPVLRAEQICPSWKLKLEAVAGATTYHSKYSIYPNFSAAGTWQDGPGASETENHPTTQTYFRPRACNACACSDWSSDAIVQPAQGECP